MSNDDIRQYYVASFFHPVGDLNKCRFRDPIVDYAAPFRSVDDIKDFYSQHLSKLPCMSCINICNFSTAQHSLNFAASIEILNGILLLLMILGLKI